MASTGVKGPNLGAHLTKMAKVIEGASVETVTKSADAAAKVQEANIRRDSGGDMKLSGVNAAKGRGGNAPVGVRVKVDKSKTRPSALVAATGPLQIINNDTVGHVIRSAHLSGGGLRSGTSKKFGSLSQAAGPGLSFGRKSGLIGPQKAAVLNIPGVGFRASARHPGTKGKNTWQDGRKVAEPVIRKSMSGRTSKVIKGIAKP